MWDVYKKIRHTKKQHGGQLIDDKLCNFTLISTRLAKFKEYRLFLSIAGQLSFFY